MARIKEFDPDEVLGRAMELFWRQGYATTSITDLVEHLGIAKASLYATFGGKHDLYLAALDRYTGLPEKSPAERLAQPGPVLPAIQSLLDSYAAPPPAGTPPGCMVVNAAVECPVDDVAVRRRLDLNWTSVEVMLTSALLRARAQGEIRADVDPAAFARYLLVLMQGMQVVSSSDQGAQRARDAARHALAALS
ncbi:TetR/AcrR family transcriptional regulator [Pseudonocardia spinosispora]|uniref:TetR/AcrR family transcriptional regulator n=1 Tax=Pseudonocardia spinosispora TaxID=103441 RepID=UPI000408F848|nr:TetR/AcrR family transcriptional regulator [Pseudonocardia spinosispora]